MCDTNYEANREKIDELSRRGVKFYNDYLDMLEQEQELDIVSISTPIQLHRKMAVEAMEKGFNVLLEKPPAVTIQDIEKIIATSVRTKRLCAVNFPQTSGKAFNQLKTYVEKGKLGKIISITGVGMWKRLDSYYTRTPWAGKLLVNDNYVLDGTINNPLAHLINNMMFLATCAGAEKVTAVTAELYHAHNIEGEDTSCLKAEMDNGMNLFYYATLCSKTQQIPYIIVEGTEGKAKWNYSNELEIEVGGKTEKTSFETEVFMENMYRNLIATISDETIKLFCSIEQTRNFVLTSNGAFESSGKIHAIPPQHIKRYDEEGSVATEIIDMNKIEDIAKEHKLFSEAGIDWAIKGKRFDLSDYKEFGMFK